MKILAIIPARGGSKRIPRKNIKKFLGFPIIKYSIDAAIKSKCFDEVMVSTDDREIANIAKRYGADIPFMRSKKNAQDKSILIDVVLEVLEQYEKLGRNFDLVCLVLPTAPLLRPEILKKGLKMMEDKNVEEVLPVVAFGYPIQRAFRIKNKQLAMLYPEFMSRNSQDLEPIYHDAGQFYFLKVSAVKKQKKMFLDKMLPIILSESEAQDIDVEEDLKILELKYKLLSVLK